MRLLDQIVRSLPEVVARDSAGVVHRLSGVARRGSLIADCTLRYILDADASEQCFALVHADAGLLDPDNPLLRLPAERFWLEWHREVSDGRADRLRLGALVEADATGRRGVVTGFFENAAGQADLTIVDTQFDLDAPLAPPVGSATAVRIRHASLPHISRLLRHVLFHLDASWEPYLRAQHRERFGRALHDLAEAAWFNLPVILAFTALLNSPGMVETRPSDLARLNRARLGRGRQPLLDHLEVRLRLGAGKESMARPGPGGRAAPRVHHVRGHFVCRAGKTFWRSSHLRGDSHAVIAAKTVSVTAPGLAAARLQPGAVRQPTELGGERAAPARPAPAALRASSGRAFGPAARPSIVRGLADPLR